MRELNFRAGVIVPPANPTVEPELSELAPAELRIHTTRFPVFSGWTGQQRNQGYLDSLPRSVRDFGTLSLDSIFIACTGSHYLLSPDEDQALCKKLSEQADANVRSATLTITDALTALGTSNLIIVSPYEDWLTQLSHDYWKAVGFEVSKVVRVRARTGYNPYDVTTDSLVDQVEATDLDDDATLLFTGTGMATTSAMMRLAKGTERRVLSSNLCGARWLTRDLDTPPTHPLLTRLDGQIEEQMI